MIPHSIETLTDVGRLNLDLFVAACGYESRATYCARQFQDLDFKNKIAVGFTLQQELQYEANKQWFINSGFEFHESDDRRYRDLVDHLISRTTASRNRLKIGYDISCLNRSRIAHIVDSIRSASCDSIDVYFFYVIAKFTAPAQDAAPTVVIEPVIPEFAGWPTHPARAPAAVIGLGYEPLKAVGVIEHLEIDKAVWAYVPVSPINEYLDGVREANQPLLKLIESEGRQMTYRVMDPASLFHEMNSLVDALKISYNPLLIPFGPKIFALVSLLVASVHNEVGVWRVSGSILEPAVDREGSDYRVCFRVRFGISDVPLQARNTNYSHAG